MGAPLEALVGGSTAAVVQAEGLLVIPLGLAHEGQQKWGKGMAWLRGKRRRFFPDLLQGPLGPEHPHLSSGGCLKNQARERAEWE